MTTKPSLHGPLPENGTSTQQTSIDATLPAPSATMMASPISSAESSKAPSVLTSPSIKVIDDSGEISTVLLPEAAYAAQHGTTKCTPVEKINPGAPSQVATPSGTILHQPPTHITEPCLQQARAAPNGKQKPPELLRNSSAFSSLRGFTSLVRQASNNNLSQAKKARNGNGKVSVAASGTNSPAPDTPELKAMMKNKQAMPDLNSVNRALEELAHDSRSLEDPFVERLRSLAFKMTLAEKECKVLLAEAMLNRDRGKYEMCRGGCTQIVKNCASKPDTKVYAYNILSTQASPGQAIYFLNESAKAVELVEDGQETAKLKKLIAVLYRSAIAKDGPEAALKASAALSKLANGEVGKSENVGGNTLIGALTPSEEGEMNVPFFSVANSWQYGALTPRTQSIIKWADANVSSSV